MKLTAETLSAQREEAGNLGELYVLCGETLDSKVHVTGG